MTKRGSFIEIGLVAVFWLLLLSLTPFSMGINWPTEFWIRQLFMLMILSAAYFFNTRYLFPKYLNTNRFITYGILIVLLTAGMLIVIEVFEQQIDLARRMHEVFRPNRPFNPDRERFSFDFIAFTLILLNFSIGIIVYLVRKNQSDAEMRKELERIQISTELSYLKAQINPHFFFNTLNNIYALTSIDTEASKKAIHTLSSMMRYVIYEGKTRFSPLSDELRFLQNYIELMKLRLPSRITVRFSTPESAGSYEIAPMVLLPFVENAFKHGVSGTQPSEILIDVKIDNGNLMFHVRNSIFPKNQLDTEEHGIGIANTRRRLELLYPNAHELKITDDGATFDVVLRIQL